MFGRLICRRHDTLRPATRSSSSPCFSSSSPLYLSLGVSALRLAGGVTATLVAALSLLLAGAPAGAGGAAIDPVGCPPIPPRADFEGTAGPGPGEMILDASASVDLDGGSIVLYEWKLPDGSTVTTSSPILTETLTPGLQAIELTVIDDEAQEGTLTRILSVP